MLVLPIISVLVSMVILETGIAWDSLDKQASDLKTNILHTQAKLGVGGWKMLYGSLYQAPFRWDWACFPTTNLGVDARA